MASLPQLRNVGESMKCLSVKQPWAQLLRSEVKRAEMRTWKTSYRGPLVICSSLQRSDTERHVDVDGPRGVTVGLFYLHDCEPVTALNVARVRRLAQCDVGLGQYAWHVYLIALLPPVRVRGQLCLFAPPSEVLSLPAIKSYQFAHAVLGGAR
jgi:hypothetical protein